jgi:uncharacterized membrane protein
MSDHNTQLSVEPLSSVRTIAHLVYALHTLAILIGIAGAASVIGSFVGSLPSIIAVVMNYAKRGDARGSWAESHYRWQIRTFWFAVLWMIIALLLILSVIGLPFGFALLAAATIWLIYRIARGWLRLVDGLPMYV